MKEIAQSQQEICQKYQAKYEPPDLSLRLGISANFFSGELPLNGLRHPSEGNMCGWYLWAGQELSQADDFFQSVHVLHLINSNSEVLRYLGLAPGWRFLIA